MAFTVGAICEALNVNHTQTHNVTDDVCPVDEAEDVYHFASIMLGDDQPQQVAETDGGWLIKGRETAVLVDPEGKFKQISADDTDGVDEGKSGNAKGTPEDMEQLLTQALKAEGHKVPRNLNRWVVHFVEFLEAVKKKDSRAARKALEIMTARLSGLYPVKDYTEWKMWLEGVLPTFYRGSLGPTISSMRKVANAMAAKWPTDMDENNSNQGNNADYEDDSMFKVTMEQIEALATEHNGTIEEARTDGNVVVEFADEASAREFKAALKTTHGTPTGLRTAEAVGGDEDNTTNYAVVIFEAFITEAVYASSYDTPKKTFGKFKSARAFVADFVKNMDGDVPLKVQKALQQLFDVLKTKADAKPNDNQLQGEVAWVLGDVAAGVAAALKDGYEFKGNKFPYKKYGPGPHHTLSILKKLGIKLKMLESEGGIDLLSDLFEAAQTDEGKGTKTARLKDSDYKSVMKGLKGKKAKVKHESETGDLLVTVDEADYDDLLDTIQQQGWTVELGEGDSGGEGQGEAPEDLLPASLFFESVEDEDATAELIGEHADAAISADPVLRARIIAATHARMQAEGVEGLRDMDAIIAEERAAMVEALKGEDVDVALIQDELTAMDDAIEAGDYAGVVEARRKAAKKARLPMDTGPGANDACAGSKNRKPKVVSEGEEGDALDDILSESEDGDYEATAIVEHASMPAFSKALLDAGLPTDTPIEPTKGGFAVKVKSTKDVFNTLLKMNGVHFRAM